MAGFGLEGYEERIPCPHCGLTDCCGVDKDELICCKTGKVVTYSQLKKSAIAHHMKKRRPTIIVRH